MKGIDTFTLKMIALFAMLCDHVGLVFFPQQIVFRMVGRISFPIFAYVLVEGFWHTHDVKRYMARLGVMAFVSEIPFDLMASKKILELGHQNIFFTLLLGVVLLYMLTKTVNPFLQFVYVAFAMWIANFLRMDYRFFGILIIFCFYYCRSNQRLKYIGITAISLLLKGWTGCFTALSLVPISLHNGEQGRKCKWFFYIFYPAHLLAIVLIRLII